MRAVEVVEPLPPEAFSNWWLAVGIALFVVASLLVAWPWLRRLLRKRKRPGADLAQEPAAPGSGGGVDAALAEIDRLEGLWRDGELTSRDAAQALAALVRDFTGQDAAVLTLLDLRSKGDMPSLTALVEAAYPVEFGVRGEGDISELAERARAAVRS
ncbi:MAG: hypothetical protein LBS27_02135 [Bifidobacteriaceae bacterium]|jgi:hypothetical protein|nr:hypothetical protein [Bifidobacteriaceae bacterium]